MGRGEEAEKGEFKIFALEFFVPNLCLYEHSTESSVWGEAGGLMPEILHLCHRKQLVEPRTELQAAHSMILVGPTQNILSVCVCEQGRRL